MKKFLLLFISFFVLILNVSAADSNLFVLTRGERFESSSFRGDYNSLNDFPYQMNYNPNPYFDNTAFWDFSSYIFEPKNIAWNDTDFQGNVVVGTEVDYPEYFVIQLPHSQFCDINKDCRIDTIIRFYDWFAVNGNRPSTNDTCDARCISSFRDNFIITQTTNACNYKTGYNGKTSDIAVSCYSMAGQELVYIKFLAAQKRFTTYNGFVYNGHWRAIGMYIKWPTAVEGNTITDLAEGGYDIFNSDYTYIISNNYDKFNVFNLHSTTISNLVLLPVNMLRKFLTSFNPTTSDFCPSFHLGTWFGTDIYIPCISLSQYLGSLWNTIDIILSAFIVYRLSKTMITAFNNFTILKEDMSEVWK